MPWNQPCRPGTSSQSSASTPAPPARLPRARCAPSTRPSQPAPPIPTPGAFSSFTLKLNREDGDQFLGKLNFTMPPGLTANLHGVTYCPEADIAAAATRQAKSSRRSRAARSSSEIGTSNVAAGPGSHPFHAYGKIYLAGPFQGAPLVWSRSPRRWPVPMTTAPSSSGSPSTSTPSMLT